MIQSNHQDRRRMGRQSAKIATSKRHGQQPPLRILIDTTSCTCQAGSDERRIELPLLALLCLLPDCGKDGRSLRVLVAADVQAEESVKGL